MGSELLADKNDLNSYGSGRVNYKRIPGIFYYLTILR